MAEIPYILIPPVTGYRLLGSKYCQAHKDFHGGRDLEGNPITITSEECVILIEQSYASPSVSEYVKLTIACCTQEVYAAVLMEKRYDLLTYLLNNTESFMRLRMIDILSALYSRTKCLLLKEVILKALKDEDFKDYCMKDNFTYKNVCLLLTF
jgi:hypothetical protein